MSIPEQPDLFGGTRQVAATGRPMFQGLLFAGQGPGGSLDLPAGETVPTMSGDQPTFRFGPQPAPDDPRIFGGTMAEFFEEGARHIEAGEREESACSHSSNEDCMFCCGCGECREDLDKDDVCGDCREGGDA